MSMIWYKIADTAEEALALVPPLKALHLQAGEQHICLFRNDDGLQALSNACPHQGAPLSRGRVNAQGHVICPWHGYCYHAGTGEEGDGRTGPAKVFPIRDDERGIFVGVPG
jgi:nitrite reductase/ring-hydroxylating ferredoxin subunit